jgi:hypothetical protein
MPLEDRSSAQTGNASTDDDYMVLVLAFGEPFKIGFQRSEGGSGDLKARQVWNLRWEEIYFVWISISGC